MKNRLSLVFLFLSLFTLGQIAEGEWNGELEVMGKSQEITLDLQNKAGFQSVFLVVPSNRDLKLEFDSVFQDESNFFFVHKQLGITYEGEYTKDSLIGVFKQNGFVLDLALTQKPLPTKALNRPQTPLSFDDFYTKEIKVENMKDSVSLSGTLTLPSQEGKFPVVVLVSGSGPQNRDSELFGHKPFAVIAEHLAKQGIGSFRYDERGVGESTGSFEDVSLSDLYRDLEAVSEVISTHESVSQFGILGHSEGGILVPKYASQNKKKVDFVILLAAPGMPVSEMMHLQREMIYKNQGVGKEVIADQKALFEAIDEVVINKNGEEKSTELKSVLEAYVQLKEMDESAKELFVETQFKLLNSNWYKEFVSVVPSEYLSKVRCSILAIGGGKDVQVPLQPNMSEIGNALKKSKGRMFSKRTIQFSRYSELNHLLQPANTGMPNEYSEIETTISRDVLFNISDFIKKQ
ncbi:MAG: alpha/beta fold hydrolase [Flavobacteriales bacterium]